MSECACDRCKGMCEHSPGWFAPGEAEGAAASMGLTLAAFFQRFLCVDWWEADEEIAEDVFVLSPRIEDQPGAMALRLPYGRCVFLTADQACAIHATKPMECRRALHDRTTDQALADHRRPADLWNCGTPPRVSNRSRVCSDANRRFHDQ